MIMWFIVVDLDWKI